MTLFRRSLIIIGVFSAGISNAKVIQILHTNDLHASLNIAGAPAVGETAYGGWAQIKTTFDQLTVSAKEQNIETIRLDAGDFFEGTLSYFPDHGINVLKAFQAMGYDAAAMGNHDWLMGAQNMNEVLGLAPFPFPVLSANTRFSPALENLTSQIVPTAQIERDGVKIGIVGLSTDELFYKWITKVDSYKKDMIIKDYRDQVDPADLGHPVIGIANARANELRKKTDLVIALTHIGVKEDKKLAASSTNIDLIVGGHSHTRLDSLIVTENRKGRMIPIVQTGATGVYIGKILVDVIPGKKPEVLSYELVPVLNNTPADPKIAELLTVSEERVAQQYGAENLNKVLGTSDGNLISGSSGKTAYSEFVVNAMKDVTGADLALDMGEFHSNSAQPGGDVTLRKLMEMYPRKLNAEQNEGLYVYQFKIPGWILKLALNISIKLGYELSMAGLEYNTYHLSDAELAAEKATMKDWKAEVLTPLRIVKGSIRINGKPVKAFKQYRVATNEFLIRGAYAISPLTKLLLRHGRPTDTTIWEASAQYMEKIGRIEDHASYAHSTIYTGDEYPYKDELIREMIDTAVSSPEFLVPELSDEMEDQTSFE